MGWDGWDGMGWVVMGGGGEVLQGYEGGGGVAGQTCTDETSEATD